MNNKEFKNISCPICGQYLGDTDINRKQYVKHEHHKWLAHTINIRLMEMAMKESKNNNPYYVGARGQQKSLFK